MKTDLEMVNVCVLNAGYTKTTSAWSGEGLSSPFVRLYYVKAGRAILTLPDVTFDVKPGHMYLVPPFTTHNLLCEAGMEFYYLFVYERYGKQTDLFDIYSFPGETEANEAIDLLFSHYCNYYPELHLPYSSGEEFYGHPAFQEYAERYANLDRFMKMQLQGFVWIVGSFFMKHASKRLGEMDERLLRVVEYIKQHIKEELSLEELASMVCITKSHLGRLFRESLGQSPLQFILNTRIKGAQRLLITTEMSVASIAREVGFNDVSYFIRSFRNRLDFTPQEYRERLR